MTDKEMARSAILVQDACNLSGVLHSFLTLVRELHSRGLDTEAVRRHPAVVLYSSKVASLTACEAGDNFSVAYDWAKSEVGDG